MTIKDDTGIIFVDYNQPLFIINKLYALLKNKDTFKIPKKYLEEYNEREYKYLFDLQKQLLNDKLKIQYNHEYEFKYSKKEFGNKKYYNFSKEVYLNECLEFTFSSLNTITPYLPDLV